MQRVTASGTGREMTGPRSPPSPVFSTVERRRSLVSERLPLPRRLGNPRLQASVLGVFGNVDSPVAATSHRRSAARSTCSDRGRTGGGLVLGGVSIGPTNPGAQRRSTRAGPRAQAQNVEHSPRRLRVAGFKAPVLAECPCPGEWRARPALSRRGGMIRGHPLKIQCVARAAESSGRVTVVVAQQPPEESSTADAASLREIGHCRAFRRPSPCCGYRLVP